jgi:hypothetical protein
MLVPVILGDYQSYVGSNMTYVLAKVFPLAFKIAVLPVRS